MKDLNEAFVHLNVGLPDDVERLKAAGYYKEAVARIDEYLAEDWTETQNSPRSQGLEMPEYEQPANPVPHGVDALRDALLVQKEIMCRLPQGNFFFTACRRYDIFKIHISNLRQHQIIHLIKCRLLKRQIPAPFDIVFNATHFYRPPF